MQRTWRTRAMAWRPLELVVEADVDAARRRAVADDDLAVAAPGQGDGAAVGERLGVLADDQADFGGGIGLRAAQPGHLPGALGPAHELQMDPRDEQPVVG